MGCHRMSTLLFVMYPVDPSHELDYCWWSLLFSLHGRPSGKVANMNSVLALGLKLIPSDGYIIGLSNPDRGVARMASCRTCAVWLVSEALMQAAVGLLDLYGQEALTPLCFIPGGLLRHRRPREHDAPLSPTTDMSRRICWMWLHASFLACLRDLDLGFRVPKG